ncbi:hypothetical protein FF38_09169 [Lucilia cuprina]|uniref:Uncharacterized protein n=1 Tax=Lucilia cuprina TaxID=7375 RepID=A0A0L0C9Q6_LUCCU|nr:hypothetical protein FF38_09169 [Lucilia cuprina]
MTIILTNKAFWYIGIFVISLLTLESSLAVISMGVTPATTLAASHDTDLKQLQILRQPLQNIEIKLKLKYERATLTVAKFTRAILTMPQQPQRATKPQNYNFHKIYFLKNTVNSRTSITGQIRRNTPRPLSVRWFFFRQTDFRIGSLLSPTQDRIPFKTITTSSAILREMFILTIRKDSVMISSCGVAYRKIQTSGPIEMISV